MKKYPIAFSLIIFITLIAKAQQAYDLIVEPDQLYWNGKAYEYTYIPNKQNLDFWTIALSTEEHQDENITYSLIDGNSKNKIITPLEKYSHSTSNKIWISEQLFIDGIQRSPVALFFKNKIKEPLKLRIFEAAESEHQFEAYNFKYGAQPKQACPCPQPGYLDREGWCPAGDCPENPAPDFTEPTHLIVHHAASTNISGNWPIVVQSIWDFHVNSNGWSDIGYNWLIDPQGIIYEGRGDNIQGAHFCGTNGNTVGICLLGDFTNQLPTGPALSSLAEFLAWKSCDAAIDPLGNSFHNSSNANLPNIAGHRDGCATACPGNTFYPTFAELRQQVRDHIDFACANLPAPTNLVGNTITTNSIALEWNDNAFDETAYLLERAEWTNQNYIALVELPADQDTYLDDAVLPNTVYFYRVRATNGIDTTAYSNEIGLSTILQQVIDLDAYSIEIFPNPIYDLLQIDLSTTQEKFSTIEVINLVGQSLWHQNNPPKEMLEVQTSSWPSGPYYLKFNLQKETFVYPIVVQ